jgi:hypothetical protein
MALFKKISIPTAMEGRLWYIFIFRVILGYGQITDFVGVESIFLVQYKQNVC